MPIRMLFSPNTSAPPIYSMYHVADLPESSILVAQELQHPRSAKERVPASRMRSLRSVVAISSHPFKPIPGLKTSCSELLIPLQGP